MHKTNIIVKFLTWICFRNCEFHFRDRNGTEFQFQPNSMEEKYECCLYGSKCKTYSFQYLQHNQISQLTKVQQQEARSSLVKPAHIHCICEHSSVNQIKGWNKLYAKILTNRILKIIDLLFENSIITYLHCVCFFSLEQSDYRWSIYYIRRSHKRYIGSQSTGRFVYPRIKVHCPKATWILVRAVW